MMMSQCRLTKLLTLVTDDESMQAGKGPRSLVTIMMMNKCELAKFQGVVIDDDEPMKTGKALKSCH